MIIRINAAFRLLAAAWWDRMTEQQQRRYIERHPRSRKKVIDQGINAVKPEEKKEPRKEEPKKESPMQKKESPTSKPAEKPQRKEEPKTETPKSAEKPTQEKPPASKSAPTSSAPVKGKAAHKAASADLNPEQVQAVKEYTGSMYLTVNPRLRAGKPVPKEDAKDVKLLDQAFSKAHTKEPIEVYRGIGFTDQDMFANIKVGQSFKDGGFVSTSTDKDTAFNFARGDTPTVMRVQVPAGSKAISVDALSTFKKGGHATRSENEILLNRG